MPSRKFDRDPRAIRHLRVRRKVIGDAGRPRLSVFRSNKHIYAQVIDDSAGHTVASSSTLDAEVSTSGEAGKSAAASLVGASVAKRAMAAGVDHVVFDRGGYRYHGRVKALADAARQEGLKF